MPLDRVLGLTKTLVVFVDVTYEYVFGVVRHGIRSLRGGQEAFD